MWMSEVTVVLFSVDATEVLDDGPTLGRLVNHEDSAKQRNSVMKVLNGPALARFATKDINPGEQIRYDYGIKVPWMVLGLLIVSLCDNYEFFFQLLQKYEKC